MGFIRKKVRKKLKEEWKNVFSGDPNTINIFPHCISFENKALKYVHI